jgi:hypothetical protein
VPACLAPPKDRYNVDAVLAAMALAEGQQKDKLQLLLGQLKIRSKP